MLLRNLHGVGFEDVSDLAGVEDVGPAMTAAWADYDGDGWLDLYVANYNLHVGLGDALPVSAEVRWSDGTQTVLDDPPTDTRWVIQY